MPYVYLVRHAQAEPVDSFCVGSGTDLSLTEEGAVARPGCTGAPGDAPGAGVRQPLRLQRGNRPPAGRGRDRPVQIEDDLRELDMAAGRARVLPPFGRSIPSSTQPGEATTPSSPPAGRATLLPPPAWNGR